MENLQNAVQHAPGPWCLNDWEAADADGAIYACGVQVVDAEDHTLNTVITEGATAEEEANVRLIAAAPDLLAVLLDDAPHPDMEYHAYSAWQDRRRAAIAKATTGRN